MALFDGEPGAAETARGLVADSLRELADNGLVADPVGAHHVQENTPETVEMKRAIFAELDRLAPPDTKGAIGGRAC